ncbi:MAG: hypothetical protein ABSE21_00185 [Bryobacteraceae bacterium]|jgi:hypothetical protein
MDQDTQLRQRLATLLTEYMETEDVSAEIAIACATADLRHFADTHEADYGDADSLGYRHYCEENGQKQIG